MTNAAALVEKAAMRIRTGALHPTIDTVFPLDDIVAAHHHLEAGKHTGKIVVTIRIRPSHRTGIAEYVDG